MCVDLSCLVLVCSVLPAASRGHRHYKGVVLQPTQHGSVLLLFTRGVAVCVWFACAWVLSLVGSVEVQQKEKGRLRCVAKGVWQFDASTPWCVITNHHGRS